MIVPARWLPRFRAAAAALPALGERESWPRERIEAWQLERLHALWSRAIRDVPHYARLAREAGLPARFDDLDAFSRSVPVLDKRAVRERPADFLTRGAGPGSWHRTSGSTGSPARFFWPPDAHRELLQARYRWLQSWDVDFLDRAVFVMPPDAGGPSSSVRRALRVAGDRLRGRRWIWSARLGVDDLARMLDSLAGFEPVWLYGYASPIQLLALEAERRGMRLPSLRLAVLTSEVVPPALAADVERGLGVPAVAEYGATECPVIAVEGRDRQLRVREDMVLVETLAREDGRHEIVITVLANSAFPLVRYAIGDVVERPLGKPDRGFAVLDRVAGREDDFLRTRTGALLDPSPVEAVLERRPAVRRFRVHQSHDGSVEVKVEVVVGRALDAHGVALEIERLLDGWPVVVRVVDAIEPGARGKRRAVTSDFPDQPVDSPVR